MNYYEVLEVSVNASKEVIKNAYRALSKKYHPDSYKGNKEFAQEKMKQINEAYETLMDDNKRLLYDYDNGFKINPNAPKEEVSEDGDREKEEVKEKSKKIDIKVLLKNKKVIAIGIVLLFIIAFIIGLIIAGGDSEKDIEEDDTDTKQVIEKQDNEKNYTNDTYKPNNSIKYNQNNNVTYEYDNQENINNNTNNQTTDEEDKNISNVDEDTSGIS